MPQFVPVYDPEKPRAEQTAADPNLRKHRQWEAPHTLEESQSESNKYGTSSRRRSEAVSARALKRNSRSGQMVQDDNGLWVKKKFVLDRSIVTKSEDEANGGERKKRYSKDSSKREVKGIKLERKRRVSDDEDVFSAASDTSRGKPRLQHKHSKHSRKHSRTKSISSSEEAYPSKSSRHREKERVHIKADLGAHSSVKVEKPQKLQIPVEDALMNEDVEFDQFDYYSKKQKNMMGKKQTVDPPPVSRSALCEETSAVAPQDVVDTVSSISPVTCTTQVTVEEEANVTKRALADEVRLMKEMGLPVGFS